VRNALYDAEVRRAVAEPSPRSAWDFVLRGDALFGSGESLDSVRAARELYEKALTVDPKFVPALISVSTAITAEMNNIERDPARVGAQAAEVDAVTRRAIEIDPQDASAWLRRSIALNTLGRPGEAVAANVKAEALDPSNPSYVVHHSLLALVLGRPDESLALAQRALAMERGLLGEESVSLRMVCESQLLLGRYEAAVRDCQEAAARVDTWYEHALLAAAYGQVADARSAETSRQVALKQQPGLTIERLAAFETSPSDTPAFRELRQRHFYDGLRKAGLAER
jgi:tetratricopeptide (TPR) repeat protein